MLALFQHIWMWTYPMWRSVLKAILAADMQSTAGGHICKRVYVSGDQIKLSIGSGDLNLRPGLIFSATLQTQQEKNLHVKERALRWARITCSKAEISNLGRGGGHQYWATQIWCSQSWELMEAAPRTISVGQGEITMKMAPCWLKQTVEPPADPGIHSSSRRQLLCYQYSN